MIGLSGFFWVSLGAILGANLRYLAHNRLAGDLEGLPVASASVNAFGCLAAGAILALSHQTGWINKPVHLFLSIGFLGSFTTFSAFGAESFGLFQAGQYGKWLSHFGLNVILSLAAVFLGHFLVSRMFQT